MMIGSIYAVIMGPTTLDVSQPSMTLGSFNVIFFVIGGVVIFGMQKLKDIKEK
jgi:putative membrane protein